jgi:hypothetical protein
MADLVKLPELLSEAEAAGELGVSVATMRRLRQAGGIRYTRVRMRIKYTRPFLIDYLERETQGLCEGNPNESSKSALTGSANDLTRQTGAEPGSTVSLTKQSAQALALRTLSPQSRRSPNGSSPTGGSPTKDLTP